MVRVSFTFKMRRFCGPNNPSVREFLARIRFYDLEGFILKHGFIRPLIRWVGIEWKTNLVGESKVRLDWLTNAICPELV